MLKRLRYWCLLPFLPLGWSWLAVFWVHTVNASAARPGNDDAIAIMICAVILTLVVLALSLARRWQGAEQAGWCVAGYSLTALAAPC